MRILCQRQCRKTAEATIAVNFADPGCDGRLFVRIHTISQGGAGNVIAPDVIDRLAYAVAHPATPLVIIIGHEGCGAVTVKSG